MANLISKLQLSSLCRTFVMRALCVHNLANSIVINQASRTTQTFHQNPQEVLIPLATRRVAYTPRVRWGNEAWCPRPRRSKELSGNPCIWRHWTTSEVFTDHLLFLTIPWSMEIFKCH